MREPPLDAFLLSAAEHRPKGVKGGWMWSGHRLG